MDIKCVFEERISKNTGKPYYVLFVPVLQKSIFLEPVELELLKVKYNLGTTDKK